MESLKWHEKGYAYSNFGYILTNVKLVRGIILQIACRYNIRNWIDDNWVNDIEIHCVLCKIPNLTFHTWQVY